MSRMLRGLTGATMLAFLVLGVAEAQTGLPSPPAEDDNTDVPLIFPAVIDFIYDGDFDVVPDDQIFRTYIVSVIKGINDRCGGDGIGIAAMSYGFPQVRRMRQDPAGALMDMLGGFMGAMETAQRGGDMFGAIESMSQGIGFVAEGVEDGGALVLTYRCNSLAIRRLRGQLDALATRRELTNPEPNDPERFMRLMHPEWRVLYGGQPGGTVPTSRSADAERQRLAEAELRRSAEAELRAYEQARTSRNIGQVNAYLNRYPSGEYVREMTDIRNELDDDAFRAAEGQNRAAAFEQYLRDFPSGRYVDGAREAVTALDAAAYRSAREQNTTASYQAYLRENPRGQHRADAEEAIRTIERNAYDNARQRRSIAGYEGYLTEYPSGRYAGQARSLIDLTRRVEATEVEIRAQRSVYNAERGRATLYGATSLATLGGTGVLGYLAYREFDAARDLESELKGLDKGSEEYKTGKADLDDTTRSALQFGVGALVALYVTREASNRRTRHSREAARAETSLRQLEQRRDDDRQRLNELLTSRLSVVPHFDDRRQPGVTLSLRF